MRRIDIDRFYTSLKEIKFAEKTNKYFLFSINTTLENAEKVVKEMSEKYSSLNTPEFSALEKGRYSIVGKYAEVDESGKPIYEGEYIKIQKDKSEEFSTEMNLYMEENKETVDKYNKITEEFDKFLAEDVGEGFISKVSIRNVPEYLSEKEFSVVRKLIKEDSKEVETIS